MGGTDTIPLTMFTLYFTPQQSTADPNATVYVSSFTAAGSATHIDAALVAKGSNGSTLAQIPDDTTAGGLKRGIRATDWQKERDVESQVASGKESTISGGARNTASGEKSWVPGGYMATTRGVYGAWAWSSGGNYSGDAQHMGVITRGTTVNTSSKDLTSDGNATVSAANTLYIPINSACEFTTKVTLLTTGGDLAVWRIEGAAACGASEATTAIKGTPQTTVIFKDSAVSAATAAVVANTTYGTLVVRISGAVGKWVAVTTITQIL